MHNFDHVILGINHMFLYPDCMVNADTHTTTLRELAQSPEINALDCWVWASHAKEELEILKNCDKQINYNIGDRIGETPISQATTDAKERVYAMDILRRESDFALECGAKKIIFGSGKDAPDDRENAKKRFIDFVLDWSEFIPKDVCLCLEIIDRDVDKRFLLGTVEDSCECIQKIQENGLKEIGILLDMGHVPLLHETLESAVAKTAPQLRHIHLGNCILKNPNNPLYGDKHACWGAADGEFDEDDGTRFLHILKDAGYLSRGAAQTISFEMRPLNGMDSQQTLTHLANWYINAAEGLCR